MIVDAGARREREPARDIDIVLREQPGRRVRVGELWCVDRLKPVALDRDASDDRVMRDGASDRELGESGVVIVPFDGLTEAVLLMLRRPRRSSAPHQAIRSERLKRRTNIRASRVECFDVRAVRGQGHARQRAARSVLPRSADRREKRPAGAVVPEHARAHDRTLVFRKVRPAIAIDINSRLAVRAAQKREPPPIGEWCGIPEPRIRRAAGRCVEQDLPLRLGIRTLRHEIDDAAHGAGTVQRRGNALDDFHPSEVQRRNLHQAQGDLLAEERQAVRQKARIASAHALNPDARGAERRRCRLDAHAAGLVQQHDDVAGSHERLLVDLFTIDDFDAHGLVFDAAIGTGRRHRDVLFDRCGAIQGERDRLLPVGRDVQ